MVIDPNEPGRPGRIILPGSEPEPPADTKPRIILPPGASVETRDDLPSMFEQLVKLVKNTGTTFASTELVFRSFPDDVVLEPEDDDDADGRADDDDDDDDEGDGEERGTDSGLR